MRWWAVPIAAAGILLVTLKPGEAQTGAPPGRVMALDERDAAFMREAAAASDAEVALGQLAAERAQDGRVRAFGQRMVADHGKAGQELRQLAESRGLVLAPSLTASHQADHDRLAQLSGSAFDRAYVEEMAKDHREDVAAFRRQAKEAANREVGAWAGLTLPTLEEHLREIEDLAKQMGVRL